MDQNAYMARLVPGYTNSWYCNKESTDDTKVDSTENTDPEAPSGDDDVESGTEDPVT